MSQPVDDEMHAEIIEAIENLGIDVKDEAADQWIEEMTAAPGEGLAVGEGGIFGMKRVLIDFNTEDLDLYRRLAEAVAIPSSERVDTAIALAGSSAQSRAQLFPGDCDMFERVNIRADSREEAVSILAELIIQNVEDVMKHENFQLTEVKVGSYPEQLTRGANTFKAGSPISWTYEDLTVREIIAQRPDGDVLTITLTSAATDPGFTKLDWVAVDAQTGRITNTSKVLDVTWEAPDGHLEPLDGAIDPYYQEVYLREESLGTVRRLIDNLSPEAVREYVEELEEQVRHYTFEKPNYGKVAKRLYNIFRILGRYEEALFLRELFDEPAAKLYQVAALLEAIARDLEDGTPLDGPTLHAEVEDMRATVEGTIGGEERDLMLTYLSQVDDAIDGEGLTGCRDVVDKASELALDTVNLFFQGHIVSNPKIWAYVESLKPAE